MSETELSTELEKAFHAEVVALRRERDRLLRKCDSAEQEVQRLRELMRVKQLREERSSAGGLYGPATAGSF